MKLKFHYFVPTGGSNRRRHFWRFNCKSISITAIVIKMDWQYLCSIEIHCLYRRLCPVHAIGWKYTVLFLKLINLMKFIFEYLFDFKFPIKSIYVSSFWESISFVLILISSSHSFNGIDVSSQTNNFFFNVKLFIDSVWYNRKEPNLGNQNIQQW